MVWFGERVIMELLNLIDLLNIIMKLGEWIAKSKVSI